MKINYTFANGETSEVDVSEEIGNVILDFRREESNLDRKERYHCYSLDAAEFEGSDYADVATPERLLLYAEGNSLREIARMECVDHKAVKKSIEVAKKYFLKNF